MSASRDHREYLLTMLQTRAIDAERALELTEDRMRATLSEAPDYGSPQWAQKWRQEGTMLKHATDSLVSFVDQGAHLLARTPPAEAHYEVTHKLFHKALDVLRRLSEWSWQRNAYRERYPGLEK